LLTLMISNKTSIFTKTGTRIDHAFFGNASPKEDFTRKGLKC